MAAAAWQRVLPAAVGMKTPAATAMVGVKNNNKQSTKNGGRNGDGNGNGDSNGGGKN